MASIPTAFARRITLLALTSLAIAMKADPATIKTFFDFRAGADSRAWEDPSGDSCGSAGVKHAEKCVFAGENENGGEGGIRTPGSV